MIRIMAGALSTHSMGRETVLIHQEDRILMVRWSRSESF